MHEIIFRRAPQYFVPPTLPSTHTARLSRLDNNDRAQEKRSNLKRTTTRVRWSWCTETWPPSPRMTTSSCRPVFLRPTRGSWSGLCRQLWRPQGTVVDVKTVAIFPYLYSSHLSVFSFFFNFPFLLPQRPFSTMFLVLWDWHNWWNFLIIKWEKVLLSVQLLLVGMLPFRILPRPPPPNPPTPTPYLSKITQPGWYAYCTYLTY